MHALHVRDACLKIVQQRVERVVRTEVLTLGAVCVLVSRHLGYRCRHKLYVVSCMFHTFGVAVRHQCRKTASFFLLASLLRRRVLMAVAWALFGEICRTEEAVFMSGAGFHAYRHRLSVYRAPAHAGEVCRGRASK